MEPLTIADQARATKACLGQLLSETKQMATSDDTAIQPNTIEDLIDRFALWAGSLGALQAPVKMLSLDYRLQDARDIRDQICAYLANLQEATIDLKAIATGKSPNRPMHEGSDDDEEPIDSDNAPKDEAHMLVEVIDQCIRSLFRMGVLIRQATPQDRFKRAMQHTELAFPNTFDIQHVERKHAKLQRPELKWFAQRLGNAMAKRRQFIKYCRDHKSRLSTVHVDVPAETETRTELLFKKAIKFMQTKYLNADFLQSKLEEAGDAASLVSASTTFDPDTLLRLPYLEDLSPDDEPFECPICFTLQDFHDEKAWKLHAFRDLRAYVCTFRDSKCQNELFDDRDKWFEHELQYHRSQYTCNLCEKGVFTSKSEFELHIESSHGSFAPDQMPMLVDISRQVPSSFNARDCQFCDEWAEWLQSRRNGQQVSNVTVSPIHFKRHVATHQEQLAIFSVLRSSEHLRSDNSQATLSKSKELPLQLTSKKAQVVTESMKASRRPTSKKAQAVTESTKASRRPDYKDPEAVFDISKTWTCCKCGNYNFGTPDVQCANCQHLRDKNCQVRKERVTLSRSYREQLEIRIILDIED
ncbi:uncharacterized protein E0L32_008875 [Thyridium curvatum]|uniref:Oxidoreductase acuF-like C2H2 type zinc-finger domain-containing protein n=1 Tax=Thyridium curvatum TaxID=1093900 RepID=A0A507AQ06_9PEZI|nr:uncharacterized protein E0L32_008875 [Thyridium curvatum]TPX09853.1 hypothetical protein E0L32_008875 [Thyridium curvatum]